jgi:glutamine amidotransferase|tara:strand:+ start:15 stop:671 length:657 start_codon:yes stop_codon:yes gene_type:complete
MKKDKPNIAIVDFGTNNLFSIKKALEISGATTFISRKKEEILLADALILPGVGAFDKAMSSLIENDLVETIKKFSNNGKYILGICLGMQLLMDSSKEFGSHDGLGLIKGVCKKFDNSKLKVPHIMWNKINVVKENDFLNIFPESLSESDSQMYFIHSYYVEPQERTSILARTLYNDFEFCSAIQKNKIIGFQFHPEKSAFEGIQILKNFINLLNNDSK